MKSILGILLMVAAGSAYAWTGVDTQTGTQIFLNGSDKLNYGERVSFRIGRTGNYRDGVIVSKFDYGNDFQLEVRDEQFGDVSVINITQ